MDKPTDQQQTSNLPMIRGVSTNTASSPSVGSQAVLQINLSSKERLTYENEIKTALSMAGLTTPFNKFKGNKVLCKRIVDLFAMGLSGHQDSLMECLRALVGLGIQMPTTGAFWSDPAVGMVKARDQLATDGTGGQVLADTALGLFAKSMKSTRIFKPSASDTPETFAPQLQKPLLFWGAVSAMYAEGLIGDVHIWLPVGLTVGSIFWNDELPVLWQLKAQNRVANLVFHLQTSAGIWDSNAVSFEQLMIHDAYVMDRDGVNKGATSLISEKGTKFDQTEMRITLAKPISVGKLKAGLQAALERARKRILSRKVVSIAQEYAKRQSAEKTT